MYKVFHILCHSIFSMMVQDTLSTEVPVKGTAETTVSTKIPVVSKFFKEMFWFFYKMLRKVKRTKIEIITSFLLQAHLCSWGRYSKWVGACRAAGVRNTRHNGERAWLVWGGLPGDPNGGSTFWPGGPSHVDCRYAPCLPLPELDMCHLLWPSFAILPNGESAAP